MPPPRPTDRFVSVRGLRIHYLDWGTEGKQPFLMLHGIARTAHTFDHVAPHFNGDYHVLAVDLPGHGDSDWRPEGAYLVEDHVRAIEEMVEQLELRDMVITGNSTGGRVAQVLAGLHPGRVSKLIVEDVGPERPSEIAAGFARRVQEEAGGWASEEELVQQLVAASPRVSEALQRAHVRAAARRRDDGRLVWKRDPALVKGFVPTELWQYVRRIACPTLYVLGGASAIVPPETQQRLRQTLPDCEIVVMPGLGHYPHLEAPEEFMAIVSRFLAAR
ncbi:MAG: alpha/beta hydrolase [Chloroflexi bacterium]|nr:alpha/beta hydrolase [Chloroflexota bacterium]